MGASLVPGCWHLPWQQATAFLRLKPGQTSTHSVLLRPHSDYIPRSSL
jgi:hypothetical protein